MGSLQASEFATATKEGQIELTQALTWHFRCNHYPPLPVSLVKVAVRIIKRVTANKLDYTDNVRLPKGITYKGSTLAPVSVCIEAWHLQDWL